MASVFQNHPRKDIIRRNWNTPLLKHIYNSVHSKYRYLGFPGPDIFDIKLWRQMIKSVVAFEIPAKCGNKRSLIIDLNLNLTLIGVKYEIYFGHWENVLINGYDNDYKKYNQQQVITLYNLDFCNLLTSKTARSKKLKRFEALNRLIDAERKAFIAGNGKDRSFIILFTVNDSYHKTIMNSFLNSDLDSNVKKLMVSALSHTRNINKYIDTNSMLLKGLVCVTFSDLFKVNQIRHTFLPMVRYYGKNNQHKMTHFCIVCKIEDMESAVPKTLQRKIDFLKLKSLRATDTGLIKDKILGESIVSNTDPVVFFNKYSKDLL